MQLGLTGKVVLVTGGSKGIGRAIVETFLAEGATVWFCGRNESDIQKAHVTLCAQFPKSRCYGIVANISNPEDLRNWVDSAVQASGQIDVIVNNVSALEMGDSPESWTKAFNIDLLGTITLVQAAVPHLEKTKGNIITIGSVSGREIDFSAPSPYGAFKAALSHYMTQQARLLAPKGIRANTVSPGNIYFKEGVWGSIEEKDPEFFKSQVARNPLGRMGKPSEVADLVVFLASERASFVSGSNLVADGALGTAVQF